MSLPGLTWQSSNHCGPLQLNSVVTGFPLSRRCSGSTRYSVIWSSNQSFGFSLRSFVLRRNIKLSHCSD